MEIPGPAPRITPRQNSQLSLFNFGPVDIPKATDFKETGRPASVAIGGASYSLLPYFDTMSKAKATEFFQLILSSPTLNTCISTRSDMIAGEGVAWLRDNEQIAQEDLPDVIRYLSYGVGQQKFRKVYRAVVNDYNAVGIGIMILRKADGLIYAEHLSPSKHRKVEGETEFIAVSSKEDFGGKANKRMVGVWPFWTDNDGFEETALIVEDQTPGYSNYPLPDWIAAYAPAKLEAAIYRMNYGQFKNGLFSRGTMLVGGAVPDGKTAQQAVRELKADLQSDDFFNQVMVQWVEGGDLENVVKWVPFDDGDRDMDFTKMLSVCETSIVRNTKLSPEVVGFVQAGSLGNNQQLKTVIQNVENRVIRPKQMAIMEDLLGPLAMELSEVARFEITAQIISSAPIIVNEDKDVWTINERRIDSGQAPIEGLDYIPNITQPTTDPNASN